MVDDLDPRYDRDAAERILQRAVELGETVDPMDQRFSAQVLREAAAELGVPAQAVLQAAAEERLGALAPDVRRFDGVVGPGRVRVRRVADTDPEAIVAAADVWMREAGFRRVRSRGTSVDYARRTDSLASARRAVRSARGRPGLGQLRRVTLVAEAVDDTTTLVDLVAHLDDQRTGALIGGAVVAGGGSVVSLVEVFSATNLWWFGVPASVAAAYGLLRVRAWTLTDVEASLDGALEHLLRSVDKPAPSLLAAGTRLVNQMALVGKAVQATTERARPGRAQSGREHGPREQPRRQPGQAPRLTSMPAAQTAPPAPSPRPVGHPPPEPEATQRSAPEARRRY